MSKATLKHPTTGAYAVECPKCRAQAGYCCFQVKAGGGMSAKKLAKPHRERTALALNPPTIPVKPSKARVAACAARANGKAKGSVTPAEALVDYNLKELRQLRQRLCVYVSPGSDRFCDCKFLKQPGYEGNNVSARSGEKSGCCEVRHAIAALETVKKAINLAKGGKD